MRIETPVKHLLVDLDGTLLGNRAIPLSLEFIRRSMKALRKYGGWRASVRTLLEIQREFRRPSPQHSIAERIARIFAGRAKLPHEVAGKILRESVLAIFPTLERHFYPIQGAREFLEWTRGRFPLTLATDPIWPIEIIELRLKWAGIDPSIFSCITHIRSMHAAKPSREYYEEILASQGLRAEDCMLVGNDVKMDLPATRVGIRVFIVGKFDKLEPFELKKDRAQAWSGSYAHLEALLAESLERTRAQA